MSNKRNVGSPSRDKKRWPMLVRRMALARNATLQYEKVRVDDKEPHTARKTLESLSEITRIKALLS